MDVPNDVVAHVVQVSNLDRDHVERVCAKLNNDRDAISRAVDQFFNGSGAFVEGKQEDGWVERKKDKIRKAGDEAFGSKTDEPTTSRRPAKGEARGEGKGVGHSKGEGRAKGSEGRGKGESSRKGRVREVPLSDAPRIERSERVVAKTAPASEAVAAPNGATAHWEPPHGVQQLPNMRFPCCSAFLTTLSSPVCVWSGSNRFPAAASFLLRREWSCEDTVCVCQRSYGQCMEPS
mmetsp:Transcript_43405/g.127685  ORF Transcript_43405/g.127685 Transcript_43405/m.127685 type:complete len:234 (-) Transcript_43405:2642-3343(-)